MPMSRFPSEPAGTGIARAAKGAKLPLTNFGGTVNTDEPLLRPADILGNERYKSGIIKCRLIHMDGRSVVQPDVLFGSDFRRQFFIPRFFDPNQIGFFDDTRNNFCRSLSSPKMKLCCVWDSSHGTRFAHARTGVYFTAAILRE